MKILNINSYYFSSRVHQEMLESVAPLVNAFDTYAPVDKNYKFRSDMEYKDFVEEKKVFSKYDRFFFHFKQYKMLRYLRNHYEVKNYNILHAHSLFTNGYTAMKISNEFNKPYVVTVRSTDVHVFFKYMIHLRKTGLKILENSEKIIFLSPSLANELLVKYVPDDKRKEIERKTTIIPNGINSFWIKNKGIPKRKPKNVIKFLYVGDISVRKNLLGVVRSLSLMPYKNELTVVGRITNQKIYEKSQKIKKFEYKGVLTHSELLKEYRQHDIFILPSITETFGLVYVEAISQGLPIIYTEHQGFDQFFDEGVVGHSVNPKKVESTINAVDNILKNYELMSENGLKLFKQFSWKKIAIDYFNLYNNSIKEWNRC